MTHADFLCDTTERQLGAPPDVKVDRQAYWDYLRLRMTVSKFGNVVLATLEDFDDAVQAGERVTVFICKGIHP